LGYWIDDWITAWGDVDRGLSETESERREEGDHHDTGVPSGEAKGDHKYRTRRPLRDNILLDEGQRLSRGAQSSSFANWIVRRETSHSREDVGRQVRQIDSRCSVAHRME